MGQYHKVYNTTKKEFLHPHKMGDGLKLMEFACGGNVATGLCILLANSNGRGGGDLRLNDSAPQDIVGRWAGDNIIIQGDYAEEGDPAYVPQNVLDTYDDISLQVVETLSHDAYMKQRMKEDWFGRDKPEFLK